jgi:hypothetical protein
MMRRMQLSRVLRLCLLVIAMVSVETALVRTLAAQDDEAEEGDDEDEEEEEAATPPAPTGPPTRSGAREVTAAVGQDGMIFELHNKARLVVPAHLPIGSARRMTFAESRARFAPAEVHGSMAGSHFTRIGPVLSFDGAINASSAPVVVSIHQPHDPSRAGQQLVLAMEQATICAEGMSHIAGSATLCSGWEILEAHYDDAAHRLSAEMRTPGGYRIVFGNLQMPPE